MKKSSLILGAAALMLATACSNDEVVNVAPQSAAIGFNSFVNKSTRGEDFTADNLKDLKVWGLSWRDGVAPYAVFAGDLVNKTIKNGEQPNTEWTYANTRYWVIGNAYSFAAVAPATEAVDVKAGTTAEDGAIASIDFTNDGEIDLLYATKPVEAGTEAADYGVVGFDFKHMLSRVQFEFVNEMNETYTIEVSDVTVKDVQTNATVDKASGASYWTVKDATKKANFEFTMDKAAKSNGQTAKSAHKYLIPYENGSSLAVAFTIKVKDIKTGEYLNGGEALIHEVTIPTIVYQAGYSYNLKTKVNGDNVDPQNKLLPIEFTVNEFAGFTPDEKGFELPKTERPATPAEGGENAGK